MPTEILTADQYLSEDWHQLRRNAISASEIAAVLGISPWATPFSLYWAKKNDWRAPVTEKMRMGHVLEPVVADLLSERLGDDYRLGKTGTWRDDAHGGLATPDRLAFSGNDRVVEVVELKTTEGYDGWGADEGDEIPVYYRAQVMWQLLVLDLQRAHVGTLFRGNHFRHYTIERHEGDIELMLKKAAEFGYHLNTDTPPPLDSGQATLDAVKRLHPDLTDDVVSVPAELADEYRSAVADLSDAKERKRAAESRLRYLMGSAARAVDEGGLALAFRSIFERQGTTVDQLRSA